MIVVDYILRQSVDNIHTNGITIKKQTSRRHPSKHLTDLDYADEMALISDTLPKAQELLNSPEKASNKVGLFLNAKKTKYMTINVDANHPPVTAQSGQVLEEVLDFKYLGPYIADSRKDFMTRKGQAWDVCNKLRLIWESNIAEETKVSFFRAYVESILLYGCETWTMNRELEKRLNGTYTRMLMRAWNLSWNLHPTRQRIYGTLPTISEVVRERRLRFAGHCYRAKDQAITNLVLWQLPTPHRNGARPLSYTTTIIRDTGIRLEDLRNAMEDKDMWRSMVKHVSPAAEGRR